MTLIYLIFAAWAVFGALFARWPLKMKDVTVATAENSVAPGPHPVADAPDTVSVGSPGNERRITNIARNARGIAANARSIEGLRTEVDDLRSDAFSGGVLMSQNSDSGIPQRAVGVHGKSAGPGVTRRVPVAWLLSLNDNRGVARRTAPSQCRVVAAAPRIRAHIPGGCVGSVTPGWQGDHPQNPCMRCTDAVVLARDLLAR